MLGNRIRDFNIPFGSRFIAKKYLCAIAAFMLKEKLNCIALTTVIAWQLYVGSNRKSDCLALSSQLLK